MSALQDASSQSVHIQSVRKSFGNFHAVRDFTLEIAAGEFVTFLGPSGCGKSTTLRILSGLMVQDGGEIHFGNRRIDMLPANKRNVGLVFQNYALFPHMTVAENIGFGLRMRGWTTSDKQKRLDEMLALVRLEGLAQRKPEQLSGGQQQRVAVARALAFQPDLVLLDEPLSNLDAKLREQVRLDLRDIQRTSRQTTVFVTHDQVEALVMSDRIVLMNAGGIEQVGSPAQLYETPTTEFGARFVGANNLLKATLLDVAGPTALIDGNGLSAPLTTLAPGLVSGMPIWYCVRPEHLRVRPVANPAVDGSNSLSGILVDKVYQGTTVLVDVEVEGAGRVSAERPVSEVSDLNVGMEVALDIQSAHAVSRDQSAGN